MITRLHYAILGLVLGLQGATAVAQQPAVAEATAAPVRLDIAPQPLAEALREFAHQSGLQLIFEAEDVNPDLRSPRLAGLYPPEAALSQLLESSGLKYKYINSHTVAIRENKESEAGRTTDVEVENREEVRLAQADAAASPPASAPVDAAASAGGKDEAMLEEIVVTAQKRVERLIDVPQAVTVLSADELVRSGATQFRDFADRVPGLSYFTHGAGFTQITLRGVTAGVDIGSTVGIYVDDVPFGSSTRFGSPHFNSLDVALFDLDRIEVLRGPQGTLYGASTMGGLIKYVTRQPEMADFGVDIRTGLAGTQDGGTSYNGAAAVNAPIVSDKVALRLNGFFSHDGGFIDNVALGEDDVDRADTFGGRLDVLITPTDALSIRLSGFAQNIDRDGEATADHALTGVPLTTDLEQRRLMEEPFHHRFRVASGTVNYDFGTSLFTSISSYQTARTETLFDFSSVPGFLPLLNGIPAFGGPFSAGGQASVQPTDKFTQEVRLASRGSRALEWLVGGFYTRETTQGETVYVFRNLAGQPAPNLFFGQENPARYEEYAAFGDLTWHFTPAFDVTGGVRLAHNQLQFEQIGFGTGSSRPLTGSSDDVLTYLANARYRFGERATAYLRYATGYRPAGPNFSTRDPNTGISLGPDTFDPDRLQSYELGIKAESADRRVGVDLAAYYIDWNDMHISATRVSSGLVFAFITNAPGGAEIRGAELTLTARPVDAFTVTGAFAYQDAQMSEADVDLRARQGERLPNVPRFTGTVNADYELPIGSLKPVIGATVRHVSDRTTSFDALVTRPQYHLPDYTTVDLRGGFNLRSVNWQLYVRNVFDEHAQLSAPFTNLGTARSAILQPRTFGVIASMKF